MWQAGISLAAAPLADRGFAAHARGLRPLFFSPRANPATNPASYGNSTSRTIPPDANPASYAG